MVKLYRPADPQIRKDGNDLVLSFPSRLGDGKVHETRFPIYPRIRQSGEDFFLGKGLEYLLNVLSAIEAKPNGETFATDAEPIQALVEEWLKTNKIKKSVPLKPIEPGTTLEDLGL